MKDIINLILVFGTTVIITFLIFFLIIANFKEVNESGITVICSSAIIGVIITCTYILKKRK